MIRHKHSYILWVALIILLAGMVAYMVGYNRYISKYSGQFDDKIVQEPIRAQKDNKDKLDETGFIISELLDADNMKEGDFLSGMNSLIYSVEDIAEDETPNFKNIF
jgi:hypothetical protein